MSAPSGTGTIWLSQQAVPGRRAGVHLLLSGWEKGARVMRGNSAPECRKSLISPKKSTLERGFGGAHRSEQQDGEETRVEAIRAGCVERCRPSPDVPRHIETSPAGAGGIGASRSGSSHQITGTRPARMMS